MTAPPTVPNERRSPPRAPMYTPRTVRRVRRRRMATGTTLFVIAAGAAVAWLQLTYDVTLPPVSHMPVVVYASPMLEPVLVRAEKKLDPVKVATAENTKLSKVERKLKKPFEALAEKVPVSFTQYCLQGRTRRDNWVREGIVAADPRVFPLGHYVELFVAGKYLGRFLVDDTGGAIKGNKIDIWTADCHQARLFGRRHGYAVLVPRETSSKD